MLYFLVEGGNDRRFLREVVSPLVSTIDEDIDFYEYATRTTKEVDKFIRSLDAMAVRYIFVADRDFHPCITSKKNALRLRYSSLQNDRIAIVDCEIESWYIGGMTERGHKRLKAKQVSPCEKFTKERFQSLQCNAFPTSVSLMNEILSDYCVATALRNCTSFQYFLRKKLQVIEAE